MDVKELIDSIIRDLTEDAPISKIMLKAQAISYSLNVEEFSEWVKKEQNGYKEGDIIPDYRKCQCLAQANLTQGFKIYTNFDVPVDAIPDKIAKEMLSYIKMGEPISEIEKITQGASQDGVLKVVAPAYAYAKVGAIFPHANVDMLWKVVNVSAATSVIEKVKSKMLEFFLELDKKTQLGIDFNKLESRKEASQIMNQTIYAGIYNTGDGDVTVTDSVVGGTVKAKSTSVDTELIKELISKIQIIKELENNPDAQDELEIVTEELKKEKPSKKVIKKSLLFLRDIAVEVGATLSAQAISSTLKLF